MSISLSQYETPRVKRAKRWRSGLAAIGAGLFAAVASVIVWSALDALILGRAIDGGEIVQIVILAIAFGFGFYANARMTGSDAL